ncbi:hypothetical protein [Caloramator proteoclasticus]|uniref:Stage IV sporulation protein FB n=1 Tax=Caloramator proteoclasticus DSM 10124 TaxID=1121262 RepID=A0A1M4TI61_9CLOT|nr:hypothetical protein [Caloramator proteoclasticus]SHE44192.1 hypothetical protein SAMN02746091_00401 [Caloramator proteoclasticus DSM 10124]
MTYVKVILLYMIFYLMHELAHILCSYIFGYTIESIKFKWTGFNINFKEEIINPIYDVAISLSGPASNLICILFFYYVFSNEILFRVNFVLFLFNIMPFNYSDGGRTLRMILKYYVGFYKSYIIVNLCSIIFAVFLLIVSFLNINKLNFILIFFVGIAIIINSIIDYNNIVINILKDVYAKNTFFKNRRIIKIKLKGVQSSNKILDIIKTFCFNKYYVIYVFENTKIIGKVTEYEIINYFLSFGNVTFEELIKKSGRSF